MARTSKVEVEIVATDEASPKIDRLESKIEGLESDEARVTITADVTRLQQQLDRAKAKAEGLEGDELTVQMRLVGSLEKDLADAKRLFDQLDGATGTVRMKADTKDATRDLTKIKSAMEGLVDEAGAIGGPLGSALGTLGATGPVVAGVAAVGAGLLAAANNAKQLALDVQNVKSLTGDSAEDTSRMIAVWKQGGGDVKDFQDVLLQMADVLGTNASLTEQLGINLEDGATGGERFAQVLELLEQIPDATTRARVASQLFGEEGVRQVNSMVNAVGDYTTALENVPSGAVMSDADIERANKLSGELSKLSAEFQALATMIGSVVVPVLSNLIGGINDVITGAEDLGHSIRGWFDNEAAENWKAVDAFEASKQAARDFDRTLLAGMTTFDEVHATVLRHTGDLNAANLVAVEWSRNQRQLDIDLAATNETIEHGIPLWEQITEIMRTYTEQVQQQIQDTRDAFVAEQQRVIGITQARTELAKLVDTQDDLESDALADALDVGDDAIDALAAVQGINDEFRDIAAWVAEHGVPNIFDHADVNAADFLRQFRGVASEVQRQVSDALGEQGPAAARALAESFVDTLANQTGMRKEDIETLLGLDDLEAKIKIAIDDSEIAKARTQLGILKAIGGDTITTAAIELALEAETITPHGALVLIQDALGDLGVPIPTALQVPTNDGEIRRETETLFRNQPIKVGAQLDVSNPFAGAGLGGGFLTPSMFTQPQQVTNITNNLAPGTPPSTVGLVTIFDSRNGTPLRTEGA